MPTPIYCHSCRGSLKLSSGWHRRHHPPSTVVGPDGRQDLAGRLGKKLV